MKLTVSYYASPPRSPNRSFLLLEFTHYQNSISLYLIHPHCFANIDLVWNAFVSTWQWTTRSCREPIAKELPWAHCHESIAHDLGSLESWHKGSVHESRLPFIIARAALCHKLCNLPNPFPEAGHLQGRHWLIPLWIYDPWHKPLHKYLQKRWNTEVFRSQWQWNLLACFLAKIFPTA